MRLQDRKYTRKPFNTLINYFYTNYIHTPEKFGTLKKVTTNYSGVHKSIRFSLFLNRKNTYFGIKQLSRSKRGRAGGRHVCISKCSRSAFRHYGFGVSASKLVYAMSLLDICYVPSVSKIYGLVLTVGGSYNVIPVTSRMTLFRLSYGCLFFSTFLWEKYFMFLFKHQRKCDCLLYIQQLTTICLISNVAGSAPVYTKAPGSTSMVVRKLLLKSNQLSIAFIQLSSGDLKIFDVSICVFLGFVCLQERIFFKNTHAGFNRKLGRRPRVRGIVKNPIDHPHGGRERTILWPRSPWGWSTK